MFDYVENNLGILKSDIKWPKKIRKIGNIKRARIPTKGTFRVLFL